MSSESAEGRPEDALQVAQQALARVAELEERVEALEGDHAGVEQSVGDLDPRDQAVVDHLTPGEAVSVTKLRGLYRRHTDVRSERTLKRRMKGLIDRPEFHFSDIGEITYDPEGGQSA